MSAPAITQAQRRALRHLAQSYTPVSLLDRGLSGRLTVSHRAVAELHAMGYVEVRADGWQAIATVAGRDALDGGAP